MYKEYFMYNCILYFILFFYTILYYSSYTLLVNKATKTAFDYFPITSVV